MSNQMSDYRIEQCLKDIKEILESKADSETKKKSIFDKIKSFGSDVAASIVANIVTNPNIFGSML